jgi:indole-3-glycerol phosphate synthase
MNILDTIIAKKHIEVTENKISYPVSVLETSDYFNLPCKDFAGAIANPNKHGIIAEIKTKSPSKGLIHADANIIEIALGYQNAGASCLSVLTDVDFFGGSNQNLILAKSVTNIPIIRKDFIIDEYQIIEAKSIGADAILLIAANLELGQCNQLSLFAKSLGLQILLELHDETELAYINEHVDAVGVNNRNLKTFEVSLTISENLIKQIPTQIVKVAESGIASTNAYQQLKSFGYQGFLMGEYFMKQKNPGEACFNFINNL